MKEARTELAVMITFNAISHIACRANAVSLPCRAAKGLFVPFPFDLHSAAVFNPYPTAFPYGNGMVLHFYQQQESSMTKTVHKVINKGLKTYV